MPAVAEVQFKATGSTEVEGAFKSIGSAASDSSTKISQNSSAMKSMGQGMKSSVSNIGAVTTAFATLAISVVSTWRAYRDLGDAQLGVDRANFKVQKSTQAVANATKLVAGLKAGMKRTDLESVAATSKIIAREEALKKKIKEGSITRKAAKAEQDAINLARSKVGSDKAAELAKAETDLKNKTEALGLAQESAAQKQKHFNDSVQDFYLSLLPTAISVIATAVSGLESMKNIVGGGGGGLIGSLSGIGLVLGAGSVALLAYKNNWLGFRDAVGGAIDWVKARFDVWKDTIGKVFNLLKSGDWNGAFKLIKEATAKFWEDLKKSNPFFGEVEKLVEKIRGGNWKGAFLQIWKAATDTWETIKTNIPMFGEVEKWVQGMVSAIAGGDWGAAAKGIQDAFNATLGKGIEWIFGKNWKAGLDAAIAKIQAEAAVNKRSVPIQILMEINAAIKNITGVDVGKWFTDHPITSKIPFFAGITMMVDDPAFRQSVISGAILVVQKVGEGITAVAGLLDPYIASFLKTIFSVEAWTTAITESATTISQTGTAIVTAIGGAISTAAADPNLTAGAMGDAAAGLWQGIQDWFTTTMPETTPVLQAIAQGFQDSIGSTAKFFQDVGQSIWNALIEGIQVAVAPFDITGALKGALDKLIIKPTMDTSEIKKGTTEATKAVNSIPKSHTTQVTVPGATQSSAAVNKLHGYINTLPTQKTIHINVVGNAGTTKGFSAGAHFQHGYQGTVKRPTTFIAGEGGRPEDVTVRPRGSVQRGGAGSSGFYGTVNVYVDGVLRPARYDMGARK